MTDPRILEGWRHGIVNTYRRGCRCDACREAKNSRERAWRAQQRKPSAGPVGPANVTEHGDPAWRPHHYPPACPACNGFSYVKQGQYWHACRSCTRHPGNQMSHEEWTELRA